MSIDNERAYVAHVIELFSAGLAAYPIVAPARMQCPACARVLQAATDLREIGDPVTISTLDHRLSVTGRQMPSEDLLAILSAGDGSLSLHDRAQSIESDWRRAEGGKISRRLQEAIERGETDDVRKHANSILELDSHITPYVIKTAAESAQAAMEMLCRNLDDVSKRVRFTDSELSHGIGTLGPGTLTVIGAGTGVGKSTLALYLARCVGPAVGIVSVEDAPEIYGARILSPLAGVSSNAIFTAKLDNADTFHALDAGLARVGKQPVIAYAIGSPLTDVLSAIKALATRHGCKLIVVDYVQAIRLDVRVDRRIGIADCVSQMKALAARLGVALVVCSQLSRPPSDAKFREPLTHHLKETGDLENMAEAIILLWSLSDRQGAPVFGKIAKLKWGYAGHRFQFQRDDIGNLECCAPWDGADPDRPRQELKENPWNTQR